MLKKLASGLACALFFMFLVTNSAYSANIQTMGPGVSVEYELRPNHPEVFVNYLFWDVSAECKISTVDASDDLFVEAKSKKGTVNGVELSAGQTLYFSAHPDEHVKISAVSGAKVIVTNLGEHSIKATCNTL